MCVIGLITYINILGLYLIKYSLKQVILYIVIIKKKACIKHLHYSVAE